MYAGIKNVLLDHHCCACERGVRRRLIADLPVEDVVVGLAFDVVANDRCIGIEGSACVDDRRQRFVLDIDQLQRVPRGVTVVGDNEGDLLAWNRTLSVASTATTSWDSDGIQARFSVSSKAPVITARTLGCASAADVSIETSLACAYGLRSTAPCSMPGSTKSST
jgi:hypothetical protein